MKDNLKRDWSIRLVSEGTRRAIKAEAAKKGLTIAQMLDILITTYQRGMSAQKGERGLGGFWP